MLQIERVIIMNGNEFCNNYSNSYEPDYLTFGLDIFICQLSMFDICLSVDFFKIIIASVK